jgi:hypothetical protein
MKGPMCNIGNDSNSQAAVALKQSQHDRNYTLYIAATIIDVWICKCESLNKCEIERERKIERKEQERGERERESRERERESE